MRAEAKLVPLCVVGAEEAMPVFAQVDILRKLTGLIYFPITPTFPWLGPLGMLAYLPAKFKIRFLEPIDTVALGGPRPPPTRALVQTVAQEIRARIQENLHDMLGKREASGSVEPSADPRHRGLDLLGRPAGPGAQVLRGGRGDYRRRFAGADP